MTPEEQAIADAAAAKAAADKVIADKAIADAADKVAADKVAADKAAYDKVVADKAAADKAAANLTDEQKESAKAAADKLADVEAKLAAATAEADKYAGIDPDKAKAALADVAAAEVKRVEAEKAQAKAEGNFEKLRELQQAESDKIVAAANARADASDKAAADSAVALDKQRVASAFGNSKFLSDETILSGPRAERLFGDHAEVEDGVVVVYDKPAGEAKRAKIMDTKGNPLPFNEAITKVIQSDVDKDTLLRTKTKPGASSSTTGGKTAPTGQTSQQKIAAGLKVLQSK